MGHDGKYLHQLRSLPQAKCRHTNDFTRRVAHNCFNNWLIFTSIVVNFFFSSKLYHFKHSILVFQQLGSRVSLLSRSGHFSCCLLWLFLSGCSPFTSVWTSWFCSALCRDGEEEAFTIRPDDVLNHAAQQRLPSQLGCSIITRAGSLITERGLL